MPEEDIQLLAQSVKLRWLEPPDSKTLGYVGQFRERKRRGKNITAKVEGNHGTYTVTLEALDGGLRSSCSCYIGKGGYCYHCHALAITFLNEPDSFVVVETRTREQVKNTPDVAAYLEGVTLDELLQELKKQGVTQQAFAAAIGMNSRHLSAVKSSEQRNHIFNELGATKLACLWMLDFVKKQQEG